MRYFTMAWWRGIQEEPVGGGEAPGAAYQAHLEAVRDRLPPDLLATQESVSLHDTRLRELVLVPADGTLSITLENFEGDERFTLLYSGVERFESGADPRAGAGLSGPAGYGDLGYTEADVLPGGTFEHRMLFSTGIELAVVFRDLRLTRDPIGS